MPETQKLPSLKGRVKELEGIYRIATTEITSVLSHFDIRNYQELKVMRAEEKIDVIIKGLNRSVVKWSRVAIPEAYQKSVDVSRTRLEILGAEKDDEFPPMTHKNSIDNEIDETIDVLVRANMSIRPNVAIYFYLARQAHFDIMQVQEFSIADDELFASMSVQIIAEGGTRQELAKLIRRRLTEELGEGKFIVIKGRNYDMVKYSRMVARTRMREVQSEAIKNMGKQFGNDLVEISSHVVEAADDVCNDYD